MWFWLEWFLNLNLWSFLWLNIEWFIPIILFLFVLFRVWIRGFFWLDKDGVELSFREFLHRWKRGVEGITPLQSTLTTLWSYPLVIGGNITGIVIMIIRKEWWLLAILIGSLPMILMGLLNQWQKYLQQRRVYDLMKELENNPVVNEVVNND